MSSTDEKLEAKLDLIVQVLQGKIEDRDDSGLIGDVDKNKYWRRRYENREDDIDKNIEHRKSSQKVMWMWIASVVGVIGKLIYEAIK